MNWIKKFEELDPKVYRSAGNKLRYMGRPARGSKLVDYGYGKEFGFYNMHFANTNVLIGKDLQFTSPEYTITMNSNSQDTNTRSTEVKNPELSSFFRKKIPTDKDIEDMLERWHNDKQRDLGFTIHFYFRPTSEAGKSKEHDKFKGYQRQPIFSLMFSIARYDHDDVHYYKEEYDKNPENIIDFWNYIKEWQDSVVFMVRPVGHYFGIFSDRKSALKFKREVYDKAIEEAQPMIVEIFSQLGGDTENLEYFNKQIKKIRLNKLYDDELTKDSRLNWAQHWYNGANLIPGTDYSD